MSDVEMGTLDLSGADLSSGDFTPIPAGWYEAHVHEVKAVEIEKEGGKLPVGTPGYNVQFRVDGGKYNNRVLFSRYYLPPADYDPEKRKVSLGIFANFLIAMGYDKDEVMSGKFQVDPSDWEGRQLRVAVSIRPAVMENGEQKYPAQNQIGSTKPLTATVGTPGLL